MIRYAILCFTLATLLGCAKPELHSLQQSYTIPNVPEGLEEFHTAQPNERLYESLPDDDKTISLHEYYRNGHRDGWDLAFKDWRLKREFQPDEEVSLYDQIGIYIEGRIDGYNAAKKGIARYNGHE